MTEQSFAEAQARALSDYGVIGRSHFVDTSSGRAHVLTAGSGPELLMVHGLGASAALWAPLLAELEGFMVHAVDLPGHGLTPRSSHPLDTGSMRGAATRFLREVTESVGMTRPITAVGNSLGSLWLNWLALDHPDDVRVLVHIGCPGLMLGASAPLPMRIGSIGGVGPLLLKLRPATRRQMYGLAALLGDDLRDHPRLADVLVAQDRVPGYQETLGALARALVRVRGARPELAMDARELGRIAQPVRLIWGDRDPLGPLDLAYEAFAALPDADLYVVHAGHAPWLTRPQEIGPQVREFV